MRPLLCLFGPALLCSPAGATPAKPPTPKQQCLPVVAAECGCVYDCGVGTQAADGTWRVRHAFWGELVLTAVVKPWCVAGQCTPAFHAEIICSGICAPRPAKPCGFKAGQCVEL
jgi:hypothetical protein